MKIKLDVLENIYAKATAKEIDFLIYIAQRQNKDGYVCGLFRKDVCKSIDISRSKFYSILNSLEEKEIIKIDYERKKYGSWDLYILDNSFHTTADYKKGYINVNAKLFYNKEFLSLRKGEKVLCLHIFSINREKRNQIPLKVETLMKRTHMTRRTVLGYIRSLEKIFPSITLKNNVLIIDKSSAQGKKPFNKSKHSENDFYNDHIIKTMAHYQNLNYEENHREDIKDTLGIFTSLKNKLGRKNILNGIWLCLKDKGKLIPQYINTLSHRSKERHISFKPPQKLLMA